MKSAQAQTVYIGYASVEMNQRIGFPQKPAE